MNHNGVGLCASAETLERLLAGSLPEEYVAGVRTHLEGCARCQSTLDRLSDHALMRQWVGAASPGELATRRSPSCTEVLANLRATPFTQAPSTPANSTTLPMEAGAGELHVGAVLGNCRILAELGRGGMGVVWKAFDAELQRVVAVKVLSEDRRDRAARERFVREARAAAAVKDDHVVAVHAVATRANGDPYLVMEYVDGPTLAKHVSGQKHLEPREAAEICRQVADGLAAAHRAGLIHRDVKPGNVLLERPQNGSRFRAKITDFGLVRLQESSDGLTQEGMVAGTPEYLSPEQISGGHDLDGRSDVYSLGVTLYETLTGEMPFRGAPHMVLQQVLNDEPVPPRRLNDRIPRDLETICLKSMAKERGRRYATATDLRDDLQRWLAGEPILARPVHRLERAWRWCRRKPALASVSAVLLATLIGFPTVLAVVQHLAHQRLLGSMAQTESQRQQADANFKKAWDAVKRYLAEVSADPRLKSEDNRDLRRRLLESAAPFFKDLVDARPDDPRLQAERGEALWQLILISQEIGAYDEALAYQREALTVFEELARAEPRNHEFANQIGRLHHRAGVIHLERFQWQEAETMLNTARDVFIGLTEAHPENANLRHNLASCYRSLGNVFTSKKRFQDAETALRTALQLQTALAQREPDVASYQDKLAETHRTLGGLYTHYFRGRLKDAETEYFTAIPILQELVRQHPADTSYQNSLATAHGQLAIVYRNTRRPEADTQFREALRVQEHLVERHLSVPSYREMLAFILTDYSSHQRNVGDQAGAEASLRKAESLRVQLVRQHPDVARYPVHLSHTRDKLGGMAIDRGDFSEAYDHYSRALQDVESATPKMQATADAEVVLVDALAGRANALSGLGKYAEALADWDRVLAKDQSFMLPWFQLRRALVLVRMGDHRTATAEAELIAAKRGAAAHDEPFLLDAARVFALAIDGANKDKALSDSERAPLTASYATRGVELLTKVTALGSANAYAQLAKLRRDEDLKSLHAQPAFQALLTDLERKHSARP